ncbi:invasin domain 3-containing protein [Providencia sp. wls1914]|uniref:invasin domain 3-containing protein n=1 Tax=Providencia sp. wls1914 TaxID=2675156 RepID=UPI0012B5C25B|nr:invasin domain 3-containing protein [Providencia sp. wls1914]MTC69345.1 hypothetical protein [Providencia sp. wls1914]
MSSASLTVKKKLANGFVIFTAIWSSAIMPVIPSYAKMLDNNDLPSLASENNVTEDNTERLVAEYSKTLGSFLSQNKNEQNLSDKAQNYVRNKVASEATKEIENWLSKAGNARLNINIDKNFSIKNSKLDWLIPWYDHPKALLFTQHSIHRSDERLHTNNGIGLRHFDEKNTIGINAFIDHDISHAHTRAGLGVEYWQDYLKFNANGYLGLTSWKSAPELNHDYNAKPAHGWDVQIESWLPAYPQLGGNLKYEQYYGDSVALFGKNQRQKNPSAATIGAHWTPFPLFTLNANHKFGSKNRSETQAKLQFTWIFGKSLAHHVDPTKVAEARRLSGNRYDFVERNNSIILDYQKKTLLSLSLPTKIQGETGQSIPLVKSFTSQYPLKHIEWNAPELLASGGSISSTDHTAVLILPSYKTAKTTQDAQKANRYRLRAIAYDVNGNASPVAETLVEVTDSGVLSINPRDITFYGKGLANGNDINGLTAIVRDSHGNTAPNAKVVFVLPNTLALIAQKANTAAHPDIQRELRKKMQAMKVAKPVEYTTTTNAKGEAQVQFTSQIAGAYEIAVYTGNHPPVKTQVTFIPDVAEAYIHNFTVSRPAVIADGISAHSVKALITDKNKNPIPNHEVNFSATNAKIVDKATTNENGLVEVTLTSVKAGASEVTLSINGHSETKVVEFISGKAHQIAILEIPEVYAGRESQVVFQIRDNQGNPIIDANNDATITIDQKVSSTPIWGIDVDNGTYAAKVYGLQSGEHTIQVAMDNIVSLERNFTTREAGTIQSSSTDGSGPDGALGVIASIDIDINPNRTNFKSGDNPLIIVTLKDSFGNAIENVDFNHLHLGNMKGKDLAWRDEGHSDYMVNLPLTTIGDLDITANINGIYSPKTVLTVSHNSGISKIDHVALSVINPTLNAGDKPTLKVELADGNGNTVTGVQQLDITIDNQTHTLPVTQNLDGSYTVELPAQHSGSKNIQVTANGKDSNQATLTVQAPTPMPTNIHGNAGEQGVLATVELTTSSQADLKSGDTLALTVTAQDTFKNPLTGLVSAIALTHAQTGKVTWVDNQDGTYSGTLAFSKLGIDTLTASVNTVSSKAISVNVANLTGHSGVQNVVITPINTTPNAGDKPTLKVELTDGNGNTITGVQQLDITIDNQTHTLPVTQNPNGSYTVELPAQHSGSKNIQVTVNGKDSNQATLTVQAPTPIPTNIHGNAGEQGVLATVELTTGSLVNLKSGDTLALTVTAKDSFKNPLTGLASAITLGHNQAGAVAWTDNQDGTYSASLPLTKLGSDTLNAAVNTITSQAISITVAPQQNRASITIVELQTQHPQVSAGQSTTLTLILRDKYNNGVVQLSSNDIKLENNKLALSNIQWQEQGNGVYTTELPFNQLGRHKLISTVNFIDSPTVDVDVTALKGAIRVHQVRLNATPKQFVVGEQIQLTLTLLDQFDNGVLDVLASDININDDNTRNSLNGLQWHHQQNGVYIADTIITKGGVHSLKATVNHKQHSVLVHAITSVGHNQVSDAQLTTNTASLTAGSSATLTLELKDQHGNPVSQVDNADIALTDNSGASIPATWVEMSNLGVYTAQVQLNTVGDHALTMAVNSISRHIDFHVTPPHGASSVTQLEISPITTVEAGQASSLIVAMKDRYGNVVNNVLNRDIAIEIDGVAHPIQLTELGDTGQYAGQLPAQSKGLHTVKITVNGQVETSNWIINNPIAISLSSFDRTGQRGALEKMTLHSSKKSVRSGDSVTLTLNLMDKFDNPLTGAGSHLSLLTDLKELSNWQDNRDGSYSIELLMNRLGSQAAQAIVKNVLSNDVDLDISALSGASSVNTAALTIKDAVIEAGDTTELTLSLKDLVDNGVINIQDNDIHLAQQNAKLDKAWSSAIDGLYTTQLQINQVGVYPLRATVNQQNSRIETIEVTAPTGHTKVAHAQLTTNTTALEAGESIELTLELKDQYGNLVTGVNGANISLNDSHTAETIDNRRIAWRMDTVGIYKASLPLSRIGKHTLRAVVNQQQAQAPEMTVNALKGAANVSKIILTSSKNIVSAGETTALTLKVQDRFGNEVDNISVSDIELTNTDTQIPTQATWVKVPTTLGTYVTDIQLNNVKPHTLVAKVNGQTQTAQINVTPLKGYFHVASVTLQAPATSEVAEQTKLVLALVDQFGNNVMAVENQHIELMLGSTRQTVTWIENQDGTYQTNLTLNQVGDYTMTVNVNTIIGTKSLRVNSPSGKDNVASIQLSASANQFLPNESTTLTLILKDTYGNAVKDIRNTDISLSDSHSPENFVSPNWAEDGSQTGVYTALVNLKKVAEHTLTANVNSIDNAIKVTVQPFTEIQHINSVELSVDNNDISMDEQVNFTLAAKDIYGNNVIINSADISMQNANGALSQPTWQLQGAQHKGALTLSASGNYVITAKVGTKTSSPISISVQSGIPVFATGKSEFSVNSDQIDEGSNANVVVKLVLKDANGNPIKGKKPQVSASAGTVTAAMNETHDGVYVSNFNNPQVGKSTITLDSQSIDYAGAVPPITVITYGQIEVKTIDNPKKFPINEGFPNTGFEGARFQITVPIGQQEDYDWSVDIDWLSIDEKGVVTMHRQPTAIAQGNAMIPIFKGAPKAHTGYKRTVDYRFTLKKWYSLQGKISAYGSKSICQAPSRLIKYKDLQTVGMHQRLVGEALIHEWGSQYISGKFGFGEFLWLADNQTSTHNSIYNPFGGLIVDVEIKNQILNAVCVEDLN